MLKIDPNNLKNPQEFEKISKEAQECDHFNYVGEYGVRSYQTMLAIDEALEKNPQFKNEDQELYKKYCDLSLYLKFHNLERLPEDNNVLELLEKNFCDALKKNLNLEEWLRAKVMMIGLPFRNEFLEKTLSAIKKNLQKIGTKNIIISNKEVEPTIQNWIKDYEYTSEPGIHSLLERNDYFIHSKNVRNLNEDEKKQIKMLLQLYDKLHLKVTDIGGLGSYPPSMYGIDLKKPVAVEDFTTKELQKVNKSVQESAGTVHPIPFPTSKTEKREKMLAENKKEAEKAMQGAVDIKKLEAQEPGNKFITSLKKIGKPRKKNEKIKTAETKVIKAVPEKEVVEEISKPETELPNPPKKVFHKEHKVLTSSKPVSAEISKIKNINLLEFKKLGATAKQAAQVLLNNIREVAKTHDERKAAQENFMKSPLFKLYEAIANQSTSEKKSVSQIAEDRKKQGTEFLTEDEYIAVKSISKLI